MANEEYPFKRAKVELSAGSVESMVAAGEEAFREVLVVHQRQLADRCACGWDVWGASWSKHVLEELRKVGLTVRFTTETWRHE